MKKSGFLLVVSALLLCLASKDSLANDDFQLLALSGDLAPETDGETFVSFGDPVINDSNQVVFFASLDSFGADNSGIWSGSETANLQLVSRRNDFAAGGGPEDAFNTYPDQARNINSAGITSFFGDLNTPEGPRRAIWTGSPDQVPMRIATTLEEAPDTEPGTVFVALSGSFSTPVFSDLGHVAVFSVLSGPSVNGSNNMGVWMGQSANDFGLVARRGNAAAAVEEGALYGSLGFPSLNSLGMIAFASALTDTMNVGVNNTSAIFKGTGPNDLTVVARAGMPAPGTETDTIFSTLLFGHDPSRPGINELGNTAFFAPLSNTSDPLPSNANTGLWVEEDGDLRMVVREGQQAAGLPEGVEYGEFVLFFAGQGRIRPIINNQGHIVFGGFLGGDVDGTNFSAMFIEEGSGNVQLVARAGDLAPGTSGDTRFGPFLGSTNPVFNNHGQLVFGQTLIGDDVNTNNNFGIWARDAFGDLRLVVREGDVIDVDRGPGVDERTIRSFKYFTSSNLSQGSANSDGRGSPLNDAGVVTFVAQFTDNSFGLFTTQAFENGAVIPGDCNGDGLVNLLDVAPFVDAVLLGEFNPCADINEDNVVDLLDVEPFVVLVSGGG